MVVINRNHTTAIVIAHDGNQVTLVPMKAGKLSASKMPHEDFTRDWKETTYSLANALERFLRHAKQRGSSQSALKGLQRLQMRDRWVVAPLF